MRHKAFPLNLSHHRHSRNLNLHHQSRALRIIIELVISCQGCYILSAGTVRESTPAWDPEKFQCIGYCYRKPSDIAANPWGYNNNALDTGSFIIIARMRKINKQRAGSRVISRLLEQAMDVAAGVIIFRLSYLLATTISPPTTKVD
jgi:hypothetical protein